ncbi:DUF4942 domain-containing protein [Rhizobium sp. SSA_523]|uniref:DUF4942 domain-containing protein n=1 Tax=Rhizobium sp. SSA_523 TaxID=2952477 RepID=UPI0020911C9B|nr:DUF4942 domain-containing protein [Rhizobium sp. SSA_523]MCO5730123.1 DUF4942 domain-containing protein [Rhizobium sp. SSA_523]WKC25188.1 DUF4942 domain-containing protein [Rhizobium sp. SSA_523]
MNAIVPRNTVEQIVRYRDQALELFENAYAQIDAAHEAERAAIDMAKRAFPRTNAYNAAHEIASRRALIPITRAPFEDYMREKRHIIDLNVWAWVVSHTDLEHLMDKEAKDQLREQMSHIIEEPTEPGQLITEEQAAKGMPPVTVDNILATLEQFMMSADTIFRRGMANAFASLDRRFRSHDGFKIGNRVILTRCFNEYGSWNWSPRKDERSTLIDIERTFTILDGKLDEVKKQDEENAAARRQRRPVAHFTKTIGEIDLARHGQIGARQTEVETDYFKVRIFKNGNAHLWFTRKDLVSKVNRMIGEYYGEVLADGRTVQDDPLSPEKAKTAPARYFGFYPTPPAAAQLILRTAPIWHRSKESDRLRILEPSAGTGNLAVACYPRYEKSWDYDRYRLDHIVDCIEIQPHLIPDLKAKKLGRVFNADFMSIEPETTGLYDLVVMNPPFDRERDIDHVMHAPKFLKPSGQLIAIMSAGTEFRQTAKSVAFRKLMEDMGATWRDLPPNSFSEVGTNVNTGFITVSKNGKRKDRYDWPTWPAVG